MSSILRHACALALTALALAGLAPTAQAQTDERCFAETGRCISGRIREYWEQNGGLRVFGLPITPQREEPLTGGTFQVQWFERARLELHPQNPPPYDVQLGRLGEAQLLIDGRDWFTFARSEPREGCRFFPETGHNVCGQFLRAWEASGVQLDGRRTVSAAESLALFGLPLSDEVRETIDGEEYTVQWFERARMELHPENQPPYDVQLGRLGATVSGAEGGAGLSLPGTSWRLEAFGPVAAPAPVAASTPATLSFGSEGRLTGNSGCNGFGGSFSVAGDQVTFGAIAGTLRACDEVTNQQERALYAALTGTVRYALEAGRLRIFAPGGADVLVFAAQSGQAEVTGSVTYRDRMALPAGAVVTVRLVDVSRQDAPAITIAEQVITTTGQQVPIAFALRYDPAQIQERNTYAVQARIELDGQLRYTSTQAYLVITQGRPTNVEVVVERV